MIKPTPRAVISRLVWLANVAIVDAASAMKPPFQRDLAEIEADLDVCGLYVGAVPTLVAALNELAHKTLLRGGASARAVARAEQARASVRGQFKEAGDSIARSKENQT
jgi:hypothetical protein